MPKTKISEFSATPANNTDIDSINLAEGMAPSLVNDAIRELMAQLKDFQTGAVGDSFNGPVGTSTAAAGAFTTLSASSTATLSGLTASTALALDASKNVVSVTNTGTGNNVLATSPTLVTPILGTPTSATLTNATGLPISTGVSGLGTGVATFLATPSSANLAAALTDETGSGANVFATSPTLVTPTLGVATATSLQGIIGNVTPAAGSFTTVDASGSVTLSGGTANGVTYLNGSKVLTSGSALTFDGTDLLLASGGLLDIDGTNAAVAMRIRQTTVGAGTEFTTTITENTGVTFDSSDSAGATARSFVWTAAATEGMRLTSTGLGIGTSSPSVKLQVKGGNGNQAVFDNAGERFTQVNWNNNGTAKGAIWIDNTNSLFELFGYSGVGMTFSTGGSERMRLDTSGNLGLGVTPSAWTDYKVFEMSAGSLASYSTGDWRMVANTTRSGNFKYRNNGYALQYLQDAGGGTHQWYTAASGTAGNTISFTQAMTLDASGNLLVGGTSQSGAANRTAVFSANKFGLSIIDTTAQATDVGGALNLGGNYRTTGDAQAFARVAAVKQNSTDNDYGYGMSFSTTPNGGTFTERARIDSSGNLLVGTTSSNFQAGERVSITPASGKNAMGIALTNTDTLGIAIYSPYTATAAVSAMQFQAHTAAIVGSITFTSTATAYNTSSDYRLKNTIAPMTNALAKVALLKPCTYKWNADGSDGEGFIAHELAEVVPECVTGAKDAVDADGNPKYQGIDTSFLVATLTAAIQEQQAIIESLKARLDAANL